jgi:hypothetical protein
MTQRIFDIENKKDYTDLWDIVPENIVKIRKGYKSEDGYYYNYYDTNNITGFYETAFLIINWHDKTEITRPIQEATEADIGKLCKFWSDETEEDVFGKLKEIDNKVTNYKYRMSGDECLWFEHCRRLTKQEIEELI